MADRPPIIRVRGVTAGYGTTAVIRDLDFEVGEGEVFGVLGGSGSGKSTLMKHMIGLNPPLGGAIEIVGRDICRARGRARREILADIGVMYQMGALFGSMTLRENVRLPLEEFTRLPRQAMDRIAVLKLGLVGLGEAAERLPDEVSGGMRKRAAIARAMALDPRILFLDEPSAGLDPITSAALDALVVDLAHSLGITFVIVTHELASVFSIIDRVIMLDSRSRRMVAEGDPRHLRDHAADPWVRRFFNREVGADTGATADAAAAPAPGPGASP